MRQFRMTTLPAILLIAAASAPAQTPAALPAVIRHDDAVYPPLARTAHVSGDVTIRFSTDGTSVTDAEAESGPTLLRKAAVDNVRTWKFAPHKPGTFHVTFEYKIVSGTQTSFLETPDMVEISTEPAPLSITWGSLAIGCFRIRLSSSHGALRKEIYFSFSGPAGQWLNAELLPLGDEVKEADYGHKEGKFLVFSMRVDEPDGKHPETLFVGTLAKSSITGTFVDEAGVRGTWTGVKFADTPTAK